jgi:hypothetical protein
MAAHSHGSDLAREITVVYADLAVQTPPEEHGTNFDLAFMLWPRRVCDAATDSRLILHREMIDLIQRNLNVGFTLGRRLIGARSLGELATLQAAHFSNQVARQSAKARNCDAIDQNGLAVCAPRLPRARPGLIQVPPNPRTVASQFTAAATSHRFDLQMPCVRVLFPVWRPPFYSGERDGLGSN